MKRFIYALFAGLCLAFLPGCGNLSPRQDQRIDNQNGRIDEIENMANSLKAEVGNIKSQNEIQNSKLDRLQQGLANFQSNYENSGVQILSGPGGLIVTLIGLLVLGVVALHYRGVAKANEKVATIFAQKLLMLENPDLEDSIFQAAMYTDVEERVLDIVKATKRSLK